MFEWNGNSPILMDTSGRSRVTAVQFPVFAVGSGIGAPWSEMKRSGWQQARRRDLSRMLLVKFVVQLVNLRFRLI